MNYRHKVIHEIIANLVLCMPGQKFRSSVNILDRYGHYNFVYGHNLKHFLFD